MKILPFILLSLVLCSCATRSAWLRFCQDYTQTYHETPPKFFWRGSTATNGQTVLFGIRSGDAQSQARVRALVGSPVVFIGDGVHYRRDVFSDIQSRDGIQIEVDIIPFRAVHPRQCESWTAEVKGTLESVDFQKQVIRIAAKPEDWRVRATY